MSDRTLDRDKPQPYTQDENGWVWRGSMMVYPFRVNQSILDALNYAYGHGYADAMTQAESQAKAARAMGEALRAISRVMDDPWPENKDDGPRAMLDYCIGHASAALSEINP